MGMLKMCRSIVHQFPYFAISLTFSLFWKFTLKYWLNDFGFTFLDWFTCCLHTIKFWSKHKHTITSQFFSYQILSLDWFSKLSKKSAKHWISISLNLFVLRAGPSFIRMCCVVLSCGWMFTNSENFSFSILLCTPLSFYYVVIRIDLFN